jgi:hypothetical protein
MLGHRQLNLDDYLEILRRHWWVILVPTLVGCVGVYLFPLSWPTSTLRALWYSSKDKRCLTATSSLWLQGT